MKNTFFLNLIAAVAIAFTLTACEKNKVLNEETNSSVSQNFVSTNQASAVAAAIKFPVEGINSDVKTRSGENLSKAVESLTEVPDENGDVVYYVINYEDGGFIILSADNRVDPILAFSDTGRFPLDLNEYPGGLVEWLGDTKNMIKNVREENMEQPEDIAFAWQPATLQRAMGGGDTESDGPNCETTYHIVGPLLQTAWGTAGWI